MKAFEAILPTHAFIAAQMAADETNAAPSNDGVSPATFCAVACAARTKKRGLTPHCGKSVNACACEHRPLAETRSAETPAPSLLKYVIAYDPIAQVERPIIFAWDIQHSTMVPLGHRAASAGFLLLAGPNLVVLPERSTSLQIPTRPQDRDILRKFLSIPLTQTN